MGIQLPLRVIRRYRGCGVVPAPGTRRWPADHGMVTLEVALALPLIVVAVVAGAVLLAAGATQARLTDAARATARELARGDSAGDALAAGRHVAPDAEVSIVRVGPVIEVAASQQIRGPGPVLGALSRTMTASVVTSAEETW